MEKLSLGTKSTRHEIITKLYNRNYITLTPLAPTHIAIAVIDALDNCDVIKPKMTALLEKDMNLISEGKKTLEETVNESRKMLTKVMRNLENNKEKIKNNIKEAQLKQNTVGKCPKCNKNLVIRFSKKGKRFVGCLGYPDCKNTYTLPQNGFIKKTNETCDFCKTPIIKIKTKSKKEWNMCLDINCKVRKN
jgi:DNA topoisomerase-1